MEPRTKSVANLNRYTVCGKHVYCCNVTTPALYCNLFAIKSCLNQTYAWQNIIYFFCSLNKNVNCSHLCPSLQQLADVGLPNAPRSSYHNRSLSSDVHLFLFLPDIKVGQYNRLLSLNICRKWKKWPVVEVVTNFSNLLCWPSLCMSKILGPSFWLFAE